MKKVIGILSVAVLAMAMFFNTNTISKNNDLNLASLVILNTASAEPDESECPGGSCSYTFYENGQKSGECSACAGEDTTAVCDESGCATI